VGEALLQVGSHLGQAVTAGIDQLTVEQLLLGLLQVGGRLVEGLTHVLAEAGQGLEQQGIQGRRS
jgi:hypothetical protein